MKSSLLLILLAVGCVEPTPQSDAGNYPYHLSTRGVRLFGRARLLVIPARFWHGAAEPLGSDEIQRAYFGGASGGPTAQNFSVASGGRFTLAGEVTRWVNTSVTAAELPSKGVVAPSREGDYVLEAIRSVDDDVDFGRFDNDGPDGMPNSGDDDGFVDGGVVIMNSDRNKTCGIVNAGGIHPHANLQWRDASGNAFATQDRGAGQAATDSAPRRIKIRAYVLTGVLGCGSDAGANVLTHELGHLLFGLPDIYHVVGGGTELWEGRRWVMGCWELMAAGSGWGCGTGIPPTSGSVMATLGAWTRMTIGWSDPEQAKLDRDSVYTLHSPATGGTVLQARISASEYFLLEYREPVTPDAMLPAKGVLIYHVDETLPTIPPDTGAHYRAELIEADDGDQLTRTEPLGGDRGSASDAFGNGVDTFSSATHSKARSTAGAPLPFEIAGITLDPANHRAFVRMRPAPAGATSRMTPAPRASPRR